LEFRRVLFRSLHILPGVGPLVRPLTARSGKEICLLPVQQAVGLNHIVDVSGCASHGVYLARFDVHANVRLHAEEPLLTLLALVHLRITLALAFLVELGAEISVVSTTETTQPCPSIGMPIGTNAGCHGEASSECRLFEVPCCKY